MSIYRMNRLCKAISIISAIVLILSITVLAIGDKLVLEMINEIADDDIGVFTRITSSQLKKTLRSLLKNNRLPSSYDSLFGDYSELTNEILGEVIQALLEELPSYARLLLKFWAYAQDVKKASIIILVISALLWFLLNRKINNTQISPNATLDHHVQKAQVVISHVIGSASDTLGKKLSNISQSLNSRSYTNDETSNPSIDSYNNESNKQQPTNAVHLDSKPQETETNTSSITHEDENTNEYTLYKRTQFTSRTQTFTRKRQLQRQQKLRTIGRLLLVTIIVCIVFFISHFIFSNTINNTNVANQPIQSKSANITINYRTTDGKAISSAQMTYSPGSYIIYPDFNAWNGYNLVGNTSYPLSVYSDGSSSINSATFYYQTPTTNYSYVSSAQNNSIALGSSVYMGHYEQDNNYYDGSEPIEWIVLKQQNDRIMLISRYILDGIKYHDRSGNITWTDCNLRSWLNNYFYYSAFSSEEQQYIQFTNNEGASDKVFILNTSEADINYLYDNWSWRKGIATDYAKAGGLYYDTNDGNNLASWWLRTANSTNSIPWVTASGSQVKKSGEIANDTSSKGGSKNGVRPVIWVDIAMLKN